MKNIFLALILLSFLNCGTEGLAQQTLSATGGKAEGSGGIVTLTVGQVTQETLLEDGYTIIQGVQIPYEIYVVTGKKEYPGVTLTCTVYPNPVTELLILKTDKQMTGNFTASLFNLHGQQIRNLKITSGETTIPMDKTEPGVYFLKIYANNKSIKIFKIIKK